MRASQSRPPGNITELMRQLDMAEHLPVFVLNGYEELENFHDLDETELDYLGITEPAQRAKILTAVDLMQDNSTTCKEHSFGIQTVTISNVMAHPFYFHIIQ